MAKEVSKLKNFLIPLLALSFPFLAFLFVTDNQTVAILTAFFEVFAVSVYIKGWHRVVFNGDSKLQKRVLAFCCLVLVAFCFFLGAVSIKGDWLYEYPLEGSVDDYGCYPQMFDAFQKGQLNIDTDYDLTVLEELENPYDTAARRKATGEKFGVIWDRAFFEGKLYSYFGIAPVIFLYYPAYFLTGKVLSDALAATLMSAVCCVFIMGLIWELSKRSKYKPPLILVLLGGITACFGSLVFPTLTNANFYHLAVLSGLTATVAFFFNVLKADACADGAKRKMYFAFSGVCVGAVVASRPNMVLYVFIALPLLISIIIKKPNGSKSLVADIFAFVTPMFMIGGLVMVYNHARFGSVFDFGSNYQLTLADTSTYEFAPSLVLPAFYHYFINPPEIDGIFPFIHMISNRLKDYGVDRVVYTSGTIGSIFIPATWGILALPVIRKHKRALLTGIVAVFTVVFMVVFDFSFGGSHLRYSTDIMFILVIAGVYLLLQTVARTKNGSKPYIALYTAVLLLFALTVTAVIPLCLDNERDMIMKYHKEFYSFLASAV